MKEISIIVPCHNAENTIEMCVQSLLQQTMPAEKMEIILVDDASTDHTYEKIKTYEKQNPGLVKVRHMAVNGRQGKARNAGMKIAEGDYIGFVDADDYVEPPMFEEMLKNTEKKTVDIVQCGYVWSETDTGRPAKKKDAQKICINTEEKRCQLIVNGLLGGFVWNHIYKRSFLKENSLWFPEKIAYEDIYFTTLLHWYAKTICLMDEKFYHYIFHKDSTMNQIDQPYYQDFLTANRKIWEAEQNHFFSPEVKKAQEFSCFLSYYINGTIMLATRFTEFNCQAFYTMQHDIMEWIPDIKENPYIKTCCPPMYQMMAELLYQELTNDEVREVGHMVQKYLYSKKDGSNL